MYKKFNPFDENVASNQNKYYIGFTELEAGD